MSAVNNEFSHKDGVSLKEYVEKLNEQTCRKCEQCRKNIDSRFDGLEKTIHERFDSTEKNINMAIRNIEHSTTLAKQSMERRLDVADEKEDLLDKQTSKLITREELNAIVKTLGAGIEAAAKGKVSWSVAIIVTVLTSLTLSLAVFAITSR